MSFSKLLAEAYFKNWTKYGMYGKRRKMNKTERGMIFFIFFEIKTIMYWIKNRKKSEINEFKEYINATYYLEKEKIHINE